MDRPFKLKRIVRKWKRGRMMPQEMHTVEENLTLHQQPPPTNRIIINVGGTRFETYRTTLKNIPDTRLAWITESKADNPDYDAATGEFFFDRHPNMFLMILNYYRTGRLHAPNDVCGPAFEDELTFWGIDEKQIESCCWGGYSEHRDAQQTLQELQIDTAINAADEEDADSNEDNTAIKFGITEGPSTGEGVWEKYRPQIWAFLDDPRSSVWAKIYTAVSLVFIFVLINAFCMETHHHFRVPRNSTLNVISHNTMSAKQYRLRTMPHEALGWVETVCLIFFTVEVIVRIIFCPNKKQFFTKPLNWVDILALLPFFIKSVLIMARPDLKFGSIWDVINGFRLIQVLRIFKLVKHFEALKILFHAIKASARELFLMVLLIGILVVLFATAIYYAEQIEEVEVNQITSIPIGFWWAVVTMTTLGYGDIVPKTVTGYFVGSICAISGVLFIALPIPIIVNNFAIYYSHAKAQAKLPKKRKHILVGAADALKQVAAVADDMLPGEQEQSERPASNESTIKPSNESITQSKRSKPATGITVHFSDVQEEEDEEINKVHEDQTNQTGNGFLTLMNNSRLSNGNVNAIQVVPPTFTVSDEQPKPTSGVPKQCTNPNQAKLRRASLIPGGVSHSAPTLERTDSLSVANTRAGPRERRQSLMPV